MPAFSAPNSSRAFGAVKGVRRIGVRLGNWLTADQGRRLLRHSDPHTVRERRDHAMLAVLIGCGLRRGELLALRLESPQQCEEHWVVADLVGKGGHVRTVPVPAWVKTTINTWTTPAGITHGALGDSSGVILHSPRRAVTKCNVRLRHGHCPTGFVRI